MRKDFEEAVKRACVARKYHADNLGQMLARHDDGTYLQMWVDSAWVVWQHKSPEPVESSGEDIQARIAFYPNNPKQAKLLGWNVLSIGEHDLYTHPGANAEDKILIDKSFIKFLNGESTLDNGEYGPLWFGDREKDNRGHNTGGRYWWRKYLPSLKAE